MYTLFYKNKLYRTTDARNAKKNMDITRTCAQPQDEKFYTRWVIQILLASNSDDFWLWIVILIALFSKVAQLIFY